MTMETVHLLDAIKAPSNPFPGLRPFEFQESELFFGRDGQVEKMIAKLAETRFLAVVGASGSGKSSLVRAGLLPALIGGMMPGARSRWRIAITRPGDDPIGGLAHSLNQPNVFGSTDPEDAAIQINVAEATLKRGSRGLIEAIRQTAMPPDERLLIVIDQFEELFRFAREAARETKERERYGNDAAAFVKLLLAASRQREVDVFVVLTMRSDFLGDCSQFWDLPEAINESQYLVPRLTRDQLREVITGPVALGGGEITTRLVNQLLNDVSDQDQLPVLQHLLMRVWDECKEKRLEVEPKGSAAGVPHKEMHKGKALDVCCYEAVGGMANALSNHADEAFNELPDGHHRKIAEKLFKRLTEKAEDNREIRRPVTFAEICAVVGVNEDDATKVNTGIDSDPDAASGEDDAIEEKVRTVIETFRQPGRSFLMPPVGLPLNSESRIDISHESLIRGWKRLMNWVTEEADSARTYQRLAETATLFRAGNADLARERDLQFALDWRKATKPTAAWALRYHPDFEGAMDFLDKSRQAREAEAIANEARRQTEFRRARRTALVFALAFVFALVALSFAAFQWTRANKALSDADAEGDKSRRLLYDANIFLAQREINAGQLGHARNLLEAFLDPRLSNLRGFEWYYLWGQIYEDKGTLTGHEGAVNSVAFSADGRTLATGSADNKAKLWDVATRKEIATLTGHTAAVWSIAFSPDGKTLATGSDDKSVKLWNVATGKEETTLPAHSTAVLSVAFSPDGKTLAAGNNDGDVMLWDMATHKELPILSGRGEGVESVAFSPDGKTLATGSEDSSVKLWDLATGKELATLSGHSDSVNSVAFSPDGKTLATASDDKSVRLWDVGTREETLPPIISSTDVYSVAFSADGKTLATGHVDNRAELWDVATRKEVAVLGGYADSVRSVVFSPDGKTLATGSDDNSAKLWDVAAGKRPATLRGHDGFVKAVAFSADGRTLATGSADNKAKLWDVATGKELATLAGHLDTVNSVAFSPDGKTLATGSYDKSVKLWNVENRKEEATLLTSGKVLSVAFSPDGKTLATGGDDKTVRLWDVAARKEIATLSGHTSTVWSVAFSPNGETLATVGGDNKLKLWNVATGKEEATLSGHSAKVLAVAFSPDGKILATGSDDRSVKLWDVGTREEIATLNGHISVVWSLAFSPDGKTLATGSYDKSVKLWDVAMHKEEATLSGHGDGVVCIAFSADGRTLATASDDRTVRLWFAVSDEEVVVRRK